MKESCLEFNKLQRPNKSICYRLRVAATFADKVSSTSVKMQLGVRFPHTNSSTGLYTFSYKDKYKLREFDKRSKHFLLGDNFINSHNFIS